MCIRDREELADLVELFGGVHIREGVGIHHRAHLVAVCQSQFYVSGIEAIRNERVGVALLHGVQRIEILRVVGVALLDQGQVAALDEHAIGLRDGHRFQVDGERAVGTLAVGHVGHVARDERREIGFGAVESVPATIADPSGIGAHRAGICGGSGTLCQVGFHILEVIDHFLGALLHSQNFSQEHDVVIVVLVEHRLRLVKADPVSYTHLDVYKRQPTDREIALCVRSLETASAATRAFLDVAQTWVEEAYGLAV